MNDDGNESIRWHLLQCFGGDTQDASSDTPSADIVSSCQFDATGTHLAAGDRGGRVVVWERETNPRARRGGFVPPVEFRFYCEFQSHDPEFDCLRSVEIEEKISNIKWLDWCAGGKFLLTSNDRTVKLWKIYERNFTAPSEDFDTASDVHLPKLAVVETATVARPRGIFCNAHTSNINSVSPCSDRERFISADEMKIHLWDVHVQHTTMNIVDRKPQTNSDSSETITTATFHPSHWYELSYATSLGCVNLCDLRVAPRCDVPVRAFRYQEPVTTIFTELISSMSDIKYSPANSRMIVTRDFMTLKVWDSAMERGPVSVIRVHDNLRGALDVLYENDCIFDRFNCAVSHDGQHVLTGSYQNMFHVFSADNTQHSSMEATTRRKKKKAQGVPPTSDADYSKKGLIVDWHPKLDVVAVCTTSNLFIFSGERNTPSRTDDISTELAGLTMDAPSPPPPLW